MAYLRSISQSCQHPLCEKRATFELINRWNASCGVFCSRHAKAKMQEHLRNERAGRG